MKAETIAAVLKKKGLYHAKLKDRLGFLSEFELDGFYGKRFPPNGKLQPKPRDPLL